MSSKSVVVDAQSFDLRQVHNSSLFKWPVAVFKLLLLNYSEDIIFLRLAITIRV